MPAPKSGGRAAATRLGVESLEDRTTPVFGLIGGESIAVGNVFPEVGAPGSQTNEYVIGAGPGQLPFVRVYDLNGTLEAEWLAYDPSYTGGVNVAVGDLFTADNTLEIITGTGVGGGPLVRVFNVNTRQQVRQFFAYEPSFRGGVNVAAGNTSGPLGNSPEEEIVVGAGPGGGPVVKTFTREGQLLSSFFAYESTFRFGVNIAVGDVIDQTNDNSPNDEIVTGPGNGGAPLAKVFDGQGGLRRSWFAFDFRDRNGLVVAVGSTDGSPGIIGGVGPNGLEEEVFCAPEFSPDANPRIRAFNGEYAGQIESDVYPFPQGYTRYINMAAGDPNLLAPANSTPSAGDPTFVTPLTGDLAVVSGELYVNQRPRLLFGGVGSAAGNNGP